MKPDKEYSIKTALFFSFLSKYFGIGLQIIATFILARILSPEEFGIFTVAHIFIALGYVIKEFGVQNYLVKEEELTKEKTDSAYTLSIFFAVLCGSAIYFSSTIISQYYNEPVLSTILKIQSVAILISPFGSIINSILIRNMDFKSILYVSLGSQIIGSTSTIFMAYKGMGVFSLVFGNLLEVVSRIVVLQFYKPENLSLSLSFKGIGRVFSYSKFVGVTGLINHIGTYIGELLVAKFSTLGVAGLFNRAVSTAGLFDKFVAQALSPVLAPYISKLNRRNEDISEKLHNLNAISLCLAWPFFIYLYIYSEQIIEVLYGYQWVRAAAILNYFCIGRLFFSTVQFLNQILLGLGKAKLLMWLQIAMNTSRISLACYGIFYDFKVFLVLICIVQPCIRMLISFFIIKRYLGVNMYNYLISFKLPIFVTIISIAPCIGFYAFIEFNEIYLNSFITLLISSSLLLPCWLFSVRKTEIGSFIKEIFKKLSI